MALCGSAPVYNYSQPVSLARYTPLLVIFSGIPKKVHRNSVRFFPVGSEGRSNSRIAENKMRYNLQGGSRNLPG